jgi:Raf kinase inhibitor-like YbhB/YbcL family protein
MRTLPLALALLAAASGAAAGTFTLKSPQIEPNATIGQAQVFNGFGCAGDNVSPALTWSDPPAGTKSFALLVHDPDAPTGGAGWWHWVVIDIPPTVEALPTGAGAADGSRMVPGARQIVTDFGAPGWGGPCPPVGHKPHRYNFSLHALDVPRIEVPAGASAALVGYMVNAHSIGQAGLTGLYGRDQ